MCLLSDKLDRLSVHFKHIWQVHSTHLVTLIRTPHASWWRTFITTWMDSMSLIWSRPWPWKVLMMEWMVQSVIMTSPCSHCSAFCTDFYLPLLSPSYDALCDNCNQIQYYIIYMHILYSLHVSVVSWVSESFFGFLNRFTIVGFSGNGLGCLHFSVLSVFMVF